jgi:NAD(P)-dependent dehydrogenase (short-subunit alcohol dehydrogenase family)
MSPDRVAVITGAASGIGLATARSCREAGMRVALIDRDADALERTTADEPSDGSLVLVADVADRQAIGSAIDEVVGRYGRIDALVNNAAVIDDYGPPAAVSDAVWDEVLAVNLRGVVHTCRAAVDVMRRGAIVNTASICGTTRAFASRSPYNAAKAAIVSLTRDLAAAYGPRGIRANVVVPGFIDTPMSRRLIAGHEAQADAERQRIPLRRLGDAREVAQTTLFLISDAASYVNGSVLTVDGGLSIV